MKYEKSDKAAKVTPLRRRTMTLEQLQLKTLRLIKKIHKHLNTPTLVSGVTDGEFFEKYCYPLEARISEDRMILSDHEETDRKLRAAAIAVIEMECERLNDGKNEPYDPIANPGQFDPRVVALAQLVWVDAANV